MPTLVIQGDADEIVPFAMGERVAGAIPGARLLRSTAAATAILSPRRERLFDAIAAGELPDEPPLVRGDAARREGVHHLVGEAVDTLVAAVSRVTLHPLPADARAAEQSIEEPAGD